MCWFKYYSNCLDFIINQNISKKYNNGLLTSLVSGSRVYMIQIKIHTVSSGISVMVLLGAEVGATSAPDKTI